MRVAAAEAEDTEAVWVAALAAATQAAWAAALAEPTSVASVAEPTSVVSVAALAVLAGSAASMAPASRLVKARVPAVSISTPCTGWIASTLIMVMAMKRTATIGPSCIRTLPYRLTAAEGIVGRSFGHYVTGDVGEPTPQCRGGTREHDDEGS